MSVLAILTPPPMATTSTKDKEKYEEHKYEHHQWKNPPEAGHMSMPTMPRPHVRRGLLGSEYYWADQHNRS
ncbi:MAG: hypothetical protein KJO81_04015 [Gammaproteobacteria bacterium]|nr:hypothetical protein [Gammaproteobacteria bacterium]